MIKANVCASFVGDSGFLRALMNSPIPSSLLKYYCLLFLIITCFLIHFRVCYIGVLLLDEDGAYTAIHFPSSTFVIDPH